MADNIVPLQRMVFRDILKYPQQKAKRTAFIDGLLALIVLRINWNPLRLHTFCQILQWSN